MRYSDTHKPQRLSYSITWSEEKSHFLIHKIEIAPPDGTLASPYPIKRHQHTKTLSDALDQYLSGKASMKLPADHFDWAQLSPFARHVLHILKKKVPPGKTISYGKLAELSGHPKAARAVGSVMANNPFPLVFPCHRVIKSDGSLGQFGSGPELKENLLALENS